MGLMASLRAREVNGEEEEEEEEEEEDEEEEEEDGVALSAH